MRTSSHDGLSDEKIFRTGMEVNATLADVSDFPGLVRQFGIGLMPNWRASRRLVPCFSHRTLSTVSFIVCDVSCRGTHGEGNARRDEESNGE